MPDPKFYFSYLELADGSKKYVKDADAREDIAKLYQLLQNGSKYIGKFTSAVVGGQTVTSLKDGDVVTSITTTKGTFVPGTPASGQYKLNEGDFTEIQGTAGKPSVEFMWNGTAMDEFGSTSLLKSLAFKDSASGSYTPAGTNAPSAVSFTGQTDGDFVTGFDTAPVAPSFSEGAFDQGSLPSFSEGAFDQGSLPSFSEGAFDAGSLPSMTYDSTNRKLTFGAGTLPSKAADTFSAGSLPTKAADTFSAGSLPSKSADTFSAGTVPTLATGKAITAVGTGEAAAQTFTGTAATITVS